MTRAGWIFLVTSWTAIVVLLVFCMVKALRSKGSG
jgi:hypothetical protein